MDQAVCNAEVFVDKKILKERRKSPLSVGTSRGGEEVEGQDVPQGSGGAKIEGPQSSPRGLSSLKEARGERRSFKCGERLGVSLEMLQCTRIARGGVSSLCQS